MDDNSPEFEELVRQEISRRLGFEISINDSRRMLIHTANLLKKMTKEEIREFGTSALLDGGMLKNSNGEWYIPKR